MTYTHKTTGWTRTALGDGTGRWRVTPADDSGERIVRPLSAGEWQNDPRDDKARQDTDRIVVVAGADLPAWADAWLLGAAQKQTAAARARLRAAIDDADDNRYFGRDW